MNHQNKYWEASFHTIVVFLWSICLFIWISFSAGVTVQSLFKELITSLYNPSNNVCIIKDIAGVHSYFYIYITMICSIASIYLLKLISPLIKRKLKSKSVIIPVTSIAIILTISLQTISHVDYFAEEIHFYSNKTLEEKYMDIYPFVSPFQYADNTNKYLTGKHHAQLITDLDMTKDPGMLIYRALAYFLYPIDIRVDLESPKDCLIVFHKKDAIKSVPEDYEILARVGEKYLLAKKKAFPNGD